MFGVFHLPAEFGGIAMESITDVASIMHQLLWNALEDGSDDVATETMAGRRLTPTFTQVPEIQG